MSNSITLRRITGDQSTFSVKARSEDKSTIEYWLSGTFDRSAAEAYCIANLPPADGHRLGRTFKLKEYKDQRDGLFKVTVNYSGPKTLSEEENITELNIRETSIGFSIGGQSRLITHSLETINSHLNNGTTDPWTPDFQNQINVVDGKPEGVELNPSAVADSQFSIEQKVRTSIITNSWLDGIDQNTNSVNTNTFRGRPAGTVLFWGMRGTVKTDEEFSTLSWEFFYAKNKTQTIGVFPNVTKKGWEYAWIYSEERKIEDNGKKAIVHLPIALYIERLFPTISMNMGTIQVAS